MKISSDSKHEDEWLGSSSHECNFPSLPLRSTKENDEVRREKELEKRRNQEFKLTNEQNQHNHIIMLIFLEA